MRVAILGCGYVGLELAQQLVAEGHEVWGVRRSESGLDAVSETGATPVSADLTDPETLDAVPDVNHIVFAASSGGRGADAARTVFVEGLRSAIDHFTARDAAPDRLVYTSSTGVYGDHDGAFVDESTPLNPMTDKTHVLAEAERVAREYAAENGLDGTVARFAGLYGPDRYRLGRYLDGPVTAGYLNMVHRDDAAGAVKFFLETDCARDDVVLVVDDEPVSKHEFAEYLADACGVRRPEKQSKQQRLDEGDLSEAAKRRIVTSKRCSNDRIRGLGYDFSYPTYREGYQDAINGYRASID